MPDLPDLPDHRPGTALVRRPGSRFDDGLTTHLDRVPVDAGLALRQWEDYVAALSFRFTAEDEALVDRLVAPGHPSTPGYNDPAYPLEGRLPFGAR